MRMQFIKYNTIRGSEVMFRFIMSRVFTELIVNEFGFGFHELK